jgi:aspartyl-tRNA(Asn)/glutamyl-tRNA(Gln) amidotransferase subunit B
MEEGSMRVDANCSVRRRGESELGVKTEVKNVNSFKALHDALAFEIVRQAELLVSGHEVEQETRHWDASAKRTSSLRTKEYASDYRYFPEPDMVPFTFDDAYVERMRATLPELPDARKARFISAYGLPVRDATALTGDLALAAFYERAVAAAGVGRSKQVSNWTLGDFSAFLNADNLEADETCVSPSALAELVGLIEDGTISGKQGKDVFAEMAKGGGAPGAIVERLGMRQLSDTSEVERIVDEVLAANPDEVASYRGGKTSLVGFFVGQVMRATKGQANPGVVNEVLARRLAQ